MIRIEITRVEALDRGEVFFMSRMTFRNYGGSYQLRIQDAQDLEKIQVLDEVHWAAISIPTNSLNCDKAFTAYVDTDKNGRIRPSELKAAWSWLVQVLADRQRMSEGSDILRLQDIDTHNPEGQKLHAAAELILTNLNMQAKNEMRGLSFNRLNIWAVSVKSISASSCSRNCI